jgi:hypothetical protein
MCGLFWKTPLVRSYQKMPGTPVTDTYFGADLQIAYDLEDRVAYIELNGPGSVDAVFHGRSLLFVPADHVLTWMSRFGEYDPADPELGYCYIYPDLSLSVWRPTVPEGPGDKDGRFFRSVGIGRVGYFARAGGQEISGG